MHENEKIERMGNSRDIVSIIHSVSSNILSIFLLGFFPLIFHNNYIDIQTYKALAFRVIAGVFLVFEICVLILSISRSKLKCSIKFRLYDYFLVLFMIGAIISTVLSQWPAYSFNGNMGRNVGTLDFLLMSSVFLLMKKQFRISRYSLYIISLVNGLEFLLIVLNFWGLDPLKMYGNLILKQHHIFIGTVGNVNAASGFLCIAVPAYMALFIINWGTYKTIIYGLLTLLGLYAGFASSCDSFLIGCAVAFVMMILYSFILDKGIRMLSACLVLFSIAAALMRVSLLVAHRVSFSTPFIAHYEKDSFLAYFINSPFLLGCICCSIVMCILSVIVSLDIQVYILKCFLCFIPVIVCVFIALFACANIGANVKYTSNIRFLNWFTIGDKFGSGRGYIWRRSLDMWRSYPFCRKMAGCGTDCFYLQMIPKYGKEMIDLFDEVFVDAHSELLQLLVTTGLIGTVGYYGFWSGLLISTIKKMKEVPCLIVGSVSICAYLAQGMINNIVPACIPLVFVVGALLQNHASYVYSQQALIES